MSAPPASPTDCVQGSLERALERLEHSPILGAWGDAVHPAVSTVTGSGWRTDLLTGRWLGHPVHPVAVMLPIGCFLAATVLDVAGPGSARPAAQRLIAVGLLATAPAVATGAADWRDTADAERRVGVAHAIANGVAVAGYAISWWVRRRGAHSSARTIGLVASACLGAAGYLGGHLAYRRGVGVNTTAFEAGPEEWTAVADIADVPLDQPTAVVSEDVVLMVLRRDSGAPVVLEDRCTHRGGPLHEGPIDRSCIVCPWHASAFDLTTGAVRRGPATMPQPVYDVRINDGRVEVRREETGGLRLNSITPGRVGGT